MKPMLIRKIFTGGCLILAILLIGTIPSQAQVKVYSAPKRLMLKGDKNAAKEERVLIREKFYPIGWSKDGKFAYYVEPPDEACGCYFGHLVIQDLQTDKILWEQEYNSEENEEVTLQTYWKKNQKEFSRKLGEFGIVAQPRFTLQNSAVAYRKDVLTPELKVNMKTDGSDLGVTGNVVLRLISKQKGKKTLYEMKFDPEKYENFLAAELSGSLLSPFEPRAAIIMIETYRGWEGPPHVTRIRIAGTTLTTGFQ